MGTSCTWCHFIRARKPNTQLAMHRWASWGSLPKFRTNQTCSIHYSHWLQREFGAAQKKGKVIHSQKWKHWSRSFIHQRLESKRKKISVAGGKSNIPAEMLEAQEISKNNRLWFNRPESRFVKSWLSGTFWNTGSPFLLARGCSGKLRALGEHLHGTALSETEMSCSKSLLLPLPHGSES